MLEFWKILKEDGEVIVKNLGRLKLGKNGRVYLSSDSDLREFLGRPVPADSNQISFWDEGENYENADNLL